MLGGKFRHNRACVVWLPLTARSFFRDPVGYVEAHGNGRSALRLSAGPTEFVLLRDPETIWRVLVTDAGAFRPGRWKRRSRRVLGPTLNTLDGEEHRQRRLMLAPAVDRGRIATFGRSIAARAERMQSTWQDGARLRLHDELDPFSLAVAGEILLSADLEPNAPELVRALGEVMAAVPRLRPPLPATRQSRASAGIERAVRHLVAKRQSAPLSGSDDDLLAILLRSGVPERTVRGEVIAFLLAAIDEPPSALAAAWYLLARNEVAERRFHEEIDAVIGDRLPTPDDQARLPYLDAVLRETLRLYPPARHIDRCPVADVRIGDVRMPARANVLASPLVTHHDERFYPRASEFVPERWLGSSGSDPLPRGTYFPFGAGVHTCIGEPLAQAIIRPTLAIVGRRWRMRLDPDPPEPIPRAPALVVTLERR